MCGVMGYIPPFIPLTLQPQKEARISLSEWGQAPGISFGHYGKGPQGSEDRSENLGTVNFLVFK